LGARGENSKEDSAAAGQKRLLTGLRATTYLDLFSFRKRPEFKP